MKKASRTCAAAWLKAPQSLRTPRATRVIATFCAFWTYCFLVLCPPVAADSKLRVSVSIPPQAYLFDRIGGTALTTRTLVPPGRSPATYEPTARQLVALGETDLYCKVGHPAFVFEGKHLDPILRKHPEIEVIDMWALHSGTKFDSATDPHIWLSPHQMLLNAREIERVLSSLSPTHSDTFRENLDGLERDIERLDAEVRSLFKAAGQRAFLVQHPAWGHFAADYGLRQLAIEKDGKQPSPGYLVALINRARNAEIHTILVQSTNSDRAAKIVAKELDAQVVRLDPLAYDWLSGLRQTAHILSVGLQNG